MKLKYLLVLIAFLESVSLFAQHHQIDTIYYDKEWKGIENPVFASYYRIYDPNDTSIQKRYRTYYINGTLQAEGFYLSIDKIDDENSIFDGKCIIYYPNGNIENRIVYSNGKRNGLFEYYYENGKLGQKVPYTDGKMDGLYISYYENGKKEEETYITNGILNGTSILYYESGNVQIRQNFKNDKLDGKYTEYIESGYIKKECHYKDGRLNGLYTMFLENGNFKQLEYENGIPKTEYYYLGTPNGQMTRYSLSTNEPYWEAMTEDDREVAYRKGTPWQYYSQNGLTIAMTNSYSNEYGKWFKLDIIIANDSVEPMTFDPYYGIVAYSTKGDETTILDVWSCAEYTSRVRKRQNTGEFFAALGEAANNYNAGYSTSTTHTTQVYGGRVDSYGVGATVGAAVGSGGYAVGGAVGAYAGSTAYLGGSSTTSTTVSYDATAAYIQSAISGQKMVALHNANLEERKAIEKGYLEKTTIYPGETISGFVYVKRANGDFVEFDFHLNGYRYKFRWN